MRHASLQSTNHGSSLQGGNERQGQRAPPGHGPFSLYEQHTERPGRRVVFRLTVDKGCYQEKLERIVRIDCESFTELIPPIPERSRMDSSPGCSLEVM